MISTSSMNGSDSLKSTLKGSLYTDPAVFEREKKYIFSKSWILVGYEYEVAETGQYIRTNVEGENIIIVRGKDRILHAFHNVCRHRGASLCQASSGKIGVIQCPYHSWSYGLDGTLVGVPNARECRQKLVKNEKFGLVRVSVATWHGLIWLNLSDDPCPVEKQLNPEIMERFGELDTFSRYGIENLRVAHREEYDVAANWKILIENFQECYHCSTIHPELTRTIPEFRTGVGTQNEIGRGGKFNQTYEAFSLSGKGTRPRIKTLLPEDDRLYYGITMVPNAFINLTPDHVIIHRLIPVSVEKSKVICDWLFEPEQMAKPEFDPMDAVNLFHRVNQQDFAACEWCQENMKSKVYQNGGFLVPLEQHVTRFYDYVLEAIGMKA
ncbi:aromatic ring-hydroxylating dioxygenase subunit alpha [Sporolactobacillus sp. THM7-7]|nr:aromatic ring-hydroxylating dioxygenase subunit alpha [Sporolactobacillus sp. THM7-7]